MIVRFAVVAAAALSCAACAKEGPMMPPMGLGFHGQIPTAVAATRTAPAPELPAGISASGEIRQTLGGKMLSAIALERVTGRKPDPARFKELR